MTISAFDWSVIWSTTPVMLFGAWITIQISLVSMFFATVIGVVLGLASLSHFWPLRLLVAAYVYFVRGVPPLVLILLIYFAPPAMGIELPRFWAGVIALSFNSGAYNVEIIRAGLVAIDTGQTEAAKAIGMTWRRTLTVVLLPQAIRNVIPQLTNELISVVKTSSLVSVISIFELTRAAQAIVAEKLTPLEIYLALSVYYVVLISIISMIAQYLEWRLRK